MKVFTLSNSFMWKVGYLFRFVKSSLHLATVWQQAEIFTFKYAANHGIDFFYQFTVLQFEPEIQSNNDSAKYKLLLTILKLSGQPLH